MKNKYHSIVQKSSLSIVFASAVSWSLMTLLDYAAGIELAAQNSVYQNNEYLLKPVANKLFISDLQVLEQRAQANLLPAEMIEKQLHRPDVGEQKITPSTEFAALQVKPQRGFEQQQSFELSSAVIEF
ncbi:hypothetical protein [Psychromonas sp.]|uniref:hypothetical protein n=1 Tax=Psychromonas sp. TaxID=1884585 RepID=UPI003563536B